MRRLLITNATILSMDETIGDIPKGAILIENDRIVAVGTSFEADGAEVIDAEGGIVCPGLINAHQHTWQTALRGIAADWPSAAYFRIVHGQIGPRYTPEDVHIGTLVGAWAQLDAGVTTLFDWSHGNATPAHSDAAIDALTQSGIRAVFGHGTVKPLPKPGELHFSQVPHPRAEIHRLRTGRLASDDALVTLSACILGPDYATLDVCRADFRLARDYGLLSSAHAWGNTNRLVPGGYRTIAAEGLLGPDHNIVHGTYMADDELRVIVDSGASVTSTAAAEMHGHVHAPLSGRIRALGGMPSIGPDTEVMNAAGMFECMRNALLLQRIFDNRATVAQREAEAAKGGGDIGRGVVATSGSLIDEVSTTSRDVLRWATVNNARALRLDHRIGSLAPGRQADLIVIARDRLGMVGADDPVHAVVHFAESADVRMVMVAGQVLKRDGRMRVEGLAERMAALRASSQRLRALVD
jgi:5-methylthioadenosine/S-adenosylhomocysteine deaminase